MDYLIFRKEHFGNWILLTLKKLLYNATTYYTTKTSIRQVIFTEKFLDSKKNQKHIEEEKEIHRYLHRWC